MQKNSNPPLYMQIMQAIIHQIENGMFSAGHKIPSVRKMSTQYGVSKATVSLAYDLLEAKGYIEGRFRSGYFVQDLTSHYLPTPLKSRPSLQSQRVSIHEVVVSIAEAAGLKEIASLGASTLSPDLLPAKELRRIASNIARHSDEWDYFYEFLPGNEELIQQLSLESIRWGNRIPEHDFIITSGAMEALQLSIRAVAQPGDLIAIESPTFYPILQNLENLNMSALEIPTDPTTGIDLDIFESLLKKHPVKAAILIPNFNNPLGHLMPSHHKQRLMEIVNKHALPVIEDDIYSDLFFTGKRPEPLKVYDSEGHVLLCSSYSKTFCSGGRVGWVVPGRFKEEVKRLKYFTNVSAPTMSQKLIAEGLKSGVYHRYSNDLRNRLKIQQKQFLQAISENFPEGTRVTSPQGGFLFWLELPGDIDTVQLYRQALTEDSSIAPGPLFSASGKDYGNCLRLMGGQIWTPKIENAIKRIGTLASKI